MHHAQQKQRSLARSSVLRKYISPEGGSVAAETGHQFALGRVGQGMPDDRPEAEECSINLSKQVDKRLCRMAAEKDLQ